MVNKIALAGCGNVGTALLEILHEKRKELYDKYSFEFEVTMITDLIKGSIVNPNGLDLGTVLNAISKDGNFSSMPQTKGTLEELLDASSATVLAEVTPTNIQTGEPGITHIKAALSRGINVTATNKGPFAIAMKELAQLARENNAKLRYEGVVMSGTPLIHMLKEGLAGCTVTKAEGILNGTTNFMLSEMGEGKSYAEALKDAQNKGYAETDPSGDIEGWDAAAKVSILSQILFDTRVEVSDVDRHGISDMTTEKVMDAAKRGFKVKLIAGVEKTDTGARAYVRPKEIPFDHPLATINGVINALTITTDNLKDITLIGPGAGRRETGQALLTDIIAMSR